MKRIKLLPLAALVLFAMIQIGGWAQTKYVPKANEELYGTWVNDNTINSFHLQKMIVFVGGLKEYLEVTDSSPFVETEQQIDSKWTDSAGNIWYKVFGKINSGPWKGRNFKALERLSRSASLLEMVVNAFDGDFGSADYPDKIERNSAFNGGYRIFYKAVVDSYNVTDKETPYGGKV